MSITARGRGVVRVPRDRAELHLGLEVSALEAVDALREAQSALAGALRVLHAHVEPRQVASEGVHLNPDYRTGEPHGFVAGHTLRVSALSVEQATELVGILARALGDRLRLHGLALAASDTADAEVTARELAMADARERAEHLAALAGGTLGAVLSVADSAVDAPVALARTASAKADALAPGEAEVEQSVTVTWELAPG